MMIYVIFAITILLIGLLVLSWFRDIGAVRAISAGVCRLLWVLPVLLSFFPRTTVQDIPGGINTTPIHVFVDDSKSMYKPLNQLDQSASSVLNSSSTIQEQVQDQIDALQEKCTDLACSIKVTKLSSLQFAGRMSEQNSRQNNVQNSQTYGVSSQFIPEYSDLNRHLNTWSLGVGQDPWIVFTDAADMYPEQSFSRELSKLSGRVRDQSRGLMVAPTPAQKPNLWIADLDAAIFAFQSKPYTFRAVLKRSESMKDEELMVQVQVRDLNGQSLASSNVLFNRGFTEAFASIVIPGLSKGKHLINVQLLPAPSERVLWDNSKSLQVEVLPNTVGILHLLGSPTWDGRYLRRYLKSEPKYDLISFFILRDPWDQQNVSEREMSLIPFPVDRLFTEELPNFRVLVIQNFSLSQFLSPEYQENLVKFVENGGGLLFLGGPRSLQRNDLANGALQRILPFNFDATHSPRGASNDLSTFGFLPFMGQPDSDTLASAQRDHIPLFDADSSFQVRLSPIAQEERAIASLYDDWQRLVPNFEDGLHLQGLHRTDFVTFKENTTTLLQAQIRNGNEKNNTSATPKSVPLAVASYPGKGRAIWMFSDSFWKLAQSNDPTIARQSYNEFMQAAMAWLMRDDLRKPLVVSQFDLRPDEAELDKKMPSLRYQIMLQGPLARFVYNNGNNEQKLWQYQLCGQAIDLASIRKEMMSGDIVSLTGVVASPESNLCSFKITGQGEAFGSIQAEAYATIPQALADDVVETVLHKIEELAQVTGAELTYLNKDSVPRVAEWLSGVTLNEGLVTTKKQNIELDYYWPFRMPWIYLCFLFLPIEVLVRRWHILH